MDIKQFLTPILGLNVADVVSAVQKLVLANLSPRQRGAGIRFAPRRVNRSLHPLLKEVTMSILKKLVAPLVGLNMADVVSAVQKLVLANLSSRKQGAGIRISVWLHISGFLLPAFAGTSFTGMTRFL